MVSGGGGGSGESTQEVDQTSTTVTEPDPFLRDLQKRFLANIPQLPKGAKTAPLAPQSLLANTLASQFGSDPSSYASLGLADMSRQLATSPLVTDTVGGNLQTLNTISDVSNLNPLSNPFLQGATQAANRQTIDTLQQEVLPSIRDSAVTAGQFGGSRQGIAEAGAVSGAAQAISDTNVRAFFGQYNQNVQNALAAAAQTPATLALPQNLISGAINDTNAANEQALRAIDVLDKSGQQLSSQAQKEINNELQAWLVNNTMPLDVLRAVGGLTAGGTSTTHTTGTTTGVPAGATVSPLQGAAGGALAGFSATGNPWGALAGGVLGLFSTM